MNTVPSRSQTPMGRCSAARKAMDVEKYWRGAAGALTGFAGLLLILAAIASKCACNEQATLHLESLDGLHFTYPSRSARLFQDIIQYLIGPSWSKCGRSSCRNATFS
jgi:hypothetical protein